MSLENEMYQRYQLELIQSLQDKAEPKTREWWQNYVKDSAPFLGVKMAEIRSIVHRWQKEQLASDLELEQQKELALYLFAGQYTEEKLAGTVFLQEILLPAGAIHCQQDLARFAGLFQEGYISDWNVCDWFCVKVLGTLINQQGAACAEAIAAWYQAENLWQARASLVSFVPVDDKAPYYPLIQAACATLIRRPERFAKTAVGWILREISRTDQEYTRRVVSENIASFSTESLKNATKYFEKDTREHFRRLLKES